MDLVFVHGALVRDGAWWWHRAAELLEQRTGVTSHAVALPSCGETDVDPRGLGLGDDAAALRTTLDALHDAVVVGHSYGGTVLAEAGDHPAVRHQVLISSYLPDEGSAQADIMSGEADPVAVADTGDGTLRVDGYDAASFGARFLQDGDASLQREAWARVTAQAIGAFTTPTTRAAWREAESTYLVCAEDRSTSLALQRHHAARATRAVELPCGHHPFLTRPELVVDVLADVLDRA